MTYKFRIWKGAFLLVILNYVCSSCNYNAEETINKTSTLLPNGKHLVVEKINKETTSVGVFTHHNYGTSHSFTYTFSINPGNINWDGGSGEPKNILFCKDTTYIRYLKEKSIKVEYTDSIDDTITYNYHDEIQEVFQKHRDERYFFNLFGDAYWVEISSQNYSSVHKSCDEYPIPNDNELSLIPIANDQVNK